MGRAGRYTLTVRHGPKVRRERFAELGAAVEAAAGAVEEVRGAGPLGAVKLLREYEAGARVAARIELASGGWLRGRAAGIDVMGDGELVAYRGGVRREPLELGEDGLAATLRRALEA